ncbi:hypothetical protein RJ639_013966, partial [Escallonia herrerae]
MSSLEEEKLFQMVYDFIESEPQSQSPPSIFSTSILQTPPLNDHHFRYTTLQVQYVLRPGSDAETEVLAIVSKHLSTKPKTESEKSSSLKKWLVIRLKLDGYDASLRQNCWTTSWGCPGDYEYIDIATQDMNGEALRLIVDIDFKSQFELARPTSAYRKLSGTLPLIFVGDEDKLNKILSLLCSAGKESLKEKGLHIPPWRTSTYM